MTKTMSWGAAGSAPPFGTTLLYLAAGALRSAGDVLTRIAAQRAQSARRPAPQVVEYHPVYRDAGAPEGALYVDGKLVGVIEGVARL